MIIKTVTNADTGTADIVGGDDWDAVAGIVNNLMDPYDYLVYKSGSTYYARNGVTQALVTSNATLSTLLSSLIATIGNSKKTIVFGSGDFILTSTITLTTSNNYLTVKGQGYGTRFLAATDIPCFYLDGAAYTSWQNLAFANDALTTKSSAFVDLGDSAVFNIFKHIQMMQNNTTTTVQKGTGFRIILDGTGQNYFNLFDDITYRNLNYCVVVDSTTSATSGVWCNGNNWTNSRAFDFLSFIKVSQKGGGAADEGHFDANGFSGLELQCTGSGAEATTDVFDFEGVAGDGLVTARFSDIIVWDKPAGANSLKITPRTTLWIGPNQNLMTTIGGTGAPFVGGGGKITPTVDNGYMDLFVTSAPSNPTAGSVRNYVTNIDGSNTGIYYKTRVNGSTVVVQV